MAIRSKTVENGRIGIIEVRGSLIGDQTTDEFRAEVNDLLEQGTKFLIIDLHRLDYITSSGIGALIAAHTSFSRNEGAVKLVGVTKGVQNIFALTKLIDVFDIYEEIEEAVESFYKNHKLN